MKYITFWKVLSGPILQVSHGRRRILSHDSSNSPCVFGHPEAHVTLRYVETSKHKMKLEFVGLTCTLALESHQKLNLCGWIRLSSLGGHFDWIRRANSYLGDPACWHLARRGNTIFLKSCATTQYRMMHAWTWCMIVDQCWGSILLLVQLGIFLSLCWCMLRKIQRKILNCIKSNVEPRYWCGFLC